MGTSQVEHHIVTINGVISVVKPQIFGRVHACHYAYASGGTGTIGIQILDEFGANLLDGRGAGITGGNSAFLTRADIGGTVAVGDLTFACTGGVPDEDYTVILYVVP